MSHPVFFVVIDKRERERDVEWISLVGTGCALPGLECCHQVDPAGGPLHTESINEFGAKDVDEQLLKLHVDA